jgi:putative ABC transport system permease protein
MKLGKCLKHAFAMVVHSKLRSWLTIIGIVIGVAAVIAIVSLGEGLQTQIGSQLSGLGGDLLTLTAGFSRGGNIFGQRGPEGGFGGGGSSQATTKVATLTGTDIQALKSLSDVMLIDTQIRGTSNVSYLGKVGRITVTGVDQRFWSQITTSTLKTGRMLDSADQNVVVIGGNLASTYFSQPVGINKMISIGGSSFRVVGILDDQSSQVYMPLSMAYQIIPEKQTGVYDTIIIKIRDEGLLNQSLNNIQSRLIITRHVTGKTQDFSLSSNKLQQQTRAATLSTMSAFLLALAAVSLIVGAVGVANTMFTSVVEKTREIGIMKAIGARNHDILLIFLLNSALIGLVGGLIGIILGMILSASLSTLSGALPLGRGGATLSLTSVLMAIFVSVIVGAFAGLIPAYQASKLKPVDALRFE